MPKLTKNPTPKEVERIRKVHKEVLDQNKDLKAIILDAVTGLRGNKRQAAWAKAINRLIRTNLLYRDAVRAKLQAMGIR